MQALDWMVFWERVVAAASRSGCRMAVACHECSAASAHVGVLLMAFPTERERDMWSREHILVADHTVERFWLDDGIPVSVGVWGPHTLGRRGGITPESDMS